jgi:pyridoxine 5-phosphate synthase
MLLGVNIDHIAVLREARAINEPNPLDAIGICKLAGADQITIHLREDRRHIQDDDVSNIIENSQLPINLECGLNDEILNIACQLKPNKITLVPEKREEVTTEGGLDISANFEFIYKASRYIKMNDIEVALFIDPSLSAIQSCQSAEIDFIELHTGEYANIDLMLNTNLSHTHNSIKDLELPRHRLKKLRTEALQKLDDATQLANDLGIQVAMGHGLNYQNIQDILKIQNVKELNIGQSIIARSIFTGLQKAIEDMKSIIKFKN